MTNKNTISSRALDYLSLTFSVPTDDINIIPVSGGYSLNRRSIVEFDDKKYFVKEVDDSLVEGNGDTERGWLKKDHQVMSLLRNESIDIVPEWSDISKDGNLLITSAYSIEDGWLWELPKDHNLHPVYINQVIGAAINLEKATFTEEDIQRLSLNPYFRDKLTDPNDYSKFINLENRTAKLVEKLEGIGSILSEQQKPKVSMLIEVIKNTSLVEDLIPREMAKLRSQPNSVFGHCDLRPDNLTYNPNIHKVVIVDWNWASITPEKFGSTEFLIACAFRGADISRWHGEINKELVVTLLGFWLEGCLRPNLGSTSTLRDHQAISAAVAYNIYETIT